MHNKSNYFTARRKKHEKYKNCDGENRQFDDNWCLIPHEQTLNRVCFTNNKRQTNHDRSFVICLVTILCLINTIVSASADLDKIDRFLDKIDEKIINKMAGSTTKRSVPPPPAPPQDSMFLYTSVATPLLTTYRYSDGNQEWYRVDVKEPEQVEEEEEERQQETYGSDLEKDHVLPTSAPAADILKNNNNKNYNNPNRYNNDMLRPEAEVIRPEVVTEREPPPRTSTGYSVLRNVRPTKSMFGKDIPSYVPPSRSFFTPPLPPELLNPFADKPTLRGTNSEGGYSIKRPLPPPSIMPEKRERIPYRPDHIPTNPRDTIKDADKERPNGSHSAAREQKVKTLNTPSGNQQFIIPPGLNRLNDSNLDLTPFLPSIGSITRLLSGTNGPKDSVAAIPDVLKKVATSPPNIYNSFEQRNREQFFEEKEEEKVDPPVAATVPKLVEPDLKVEHVAPVQKPEITTTMTDILNLPNVNIKERNDVVSNATKAATSGHEIWHICWNVHVYLVVFLYVLLAVFSIVKLIRFERETHMFSKSYFLSVHLLLTSICVLRIFYLAYDPYNVNLSFTLFTYELLHNLPLSLLATTFAVLIVFLLKRTLNHLKVKTRPIFLVLFGLGHMFLCFCLNLSETFGLFNRGSFLSLVCRFVYILLCWSLGLSYVYLYKIIKNVLAKKSQNLSEMCTQNISYASHITIAVALLFTLLGFVQLYGLFFIKIDQFIIPYHWILWGFELSVRLLEISIIALLAIVVSLRMSQREKQTVGFPLFPCTTSDSSTDNIYPNNCSTNLNALNYSLRSSQAQYRQQQQELALENLPTDIVDRPTLDKKSTLDRCFQNQVLEPESQSDHDRNSVYEPPIIRGASFDRFERPNWSQRFNEDSFPVRNFERSSDSDQRSSGRVPRSFDQDYGSGRLKPYEKCRYYAKPKYDSDNLYNNSSDPDEQQQLPQHAQKILKLRHDEEPNVYSEPLDVNAHNLDRADLERRSRTSWNNSGRRSTGRSSRKSGGIACRPHQGGVHTLPNQDTNNSMLVDENGFVRFRQLGNAEQQLEQQQQQQQVKAPKKHYRHHHSDVNHYSDA